MFYNKQSITVLILFLQIQILPLLCSLSLFLRISFSSPRYSLQCFLHTSTNPCSTCPPTPPTAPHAPELQRCTDTPMVTQAVQSPHACMRASAPAGGVTRPCGHLARPRDPYVALGGCTETRSFSISQNNSSEMHCCHPNACIRSAR